MADGADVNAKTGGGVTPLHDAAFGHKEIAELLIDKGADVDAQDVNGWTPLHCAARNGHKEIAELLLAKGADVGVKNKAGFTPLHLAAYWDHTKIVKLLIAEGADVNAKDEDGVTPLHEAALWGHNEVAELLIANGAEVNAIIVSGPYQGKTPLDLAIRHKKNETTNLLRKHGSKTSEELARMPRLEYGKDQWPFGFSFTAEDEKNYVVEVTQDFKQWGKLETINGTGKQVKFIDPRQPLVPFKRNFYRVKLVD